MFITGTAQVSSHISWNRGDRNPSKPYWMAEMYALGPWRRASAQHILLNWKQQQSGHKDTPHLPNSPFTVFHKSLLPPPPAFPEHCCPGTACGSSSALQQQVCQQPPGHPLRHPQAVPSLTGPVVSTQVHTLSLSPTCWFSSLQPLQVTLFQAAAWVSASLLAEGRRLSMRLSNIHKALHPADLYPVTNRSASLQSSWEQIHSSVPKDICSQHGGKATLSTPTPRDHHPLGINPAGPSSTAPHDHSGLVTVIEQPLLQKDLEEDCMAVTQAHTQRFYWNSFKQADKNEMDSLINSSPPCLTPSPEQEITCLSLDFALPAAPHAVKLLLSYTERGMVGNQNCRWLWLCSQKEADLQDMERIHSLKAPVG